jgi:hypothetical protein
MSEIMIRRLDRRQQVTIGTTAGESSTLAFNGMAGATILLGTPSTSATLLRVYGSHNNVTYRELFDAAGAAATITLSRLSGTAVETVGTATAEITVFTATAGAYALPDAAYPLRYVRLVADTDLGEAATAEITVKS